MAHRRRAMACTVKTSIDRPYVAIVHAHTGHEESQHRAAWWVFLRRAPFRPGETRNNLEGEMRS